MMAVDGHDAGDDQWEKADQPHWRGLGLTDPIKSVEVRFSVRLPNLEGQNRISNSRQTFQ